MDNPTTIISQNVINVDIGGIKYVKIETRTSGVAFTSGKFTVYGR